MEILINEAYNNFISDVGRSREVGVGRSRETIIKLYSEQQLLDSQFERPFLSGA